ncbi:KN motif and ankyrin repeat domain-containing protein 4-like [Carassius carassius]|uniref:KN motif and ankyrin repeat domain-containing protein 4-like n=1 Tax=Carassius carassius TaxID=217509 RepID=UPI0028685243|nr:KN motif and ankyrin repeat domain-containing protein 4-like [Carassius carassius]XP_059358386.1 KN motif and ankyrin repeat domain-containing protein 4-like [Carassius carassius]
METKKENGISPKENGSQRRPPTYSVETPYGFHLDLDFLKYVDDIEKGNTIRRVPMQRRQRGRNNDILSRNLSLPGYGCRATEWNSVSTFWPKTKLRDSQQHFEFRSSDRGEPIYKSFTSAEMEAFDEQPLGCYVRPNLLRASSLPLTVLLRKRSESSEDPTSPSSPKECLMQENGSSEELFYTSDSRMGRPNGTIQRLTAALERVGELEEEIRVIPELKAQICIMQEERERLLLQLYSQNKTTEPQDVLTDPLHINNWDTPSTASENQDKASDDWMNREYDRLEENVKASSEQVDAVVITSVTERILPEIERRQTVLRERDLLENGDKTKSLTETLQRKVVWLEQKLHEIEVELDKTRALLKQQVEESLLKDDKIKQLTIQLEMECTLAKVISSESSLVSTQSLVTVVELQERGQKMETTPQVLDQPPVSHADMEHHVKRLQELLQEQWECLCKDDSSGKMSSDHLPPRVCTIQKQLTTLVTLLTLCVFPTVDASQPDCKMMEVLPEVGENPKTEHLKTISIRDSGSVETEGISNAIKLSGCSAEVDVGLKKNTTKEEGKLWTTWITDSSGKKTHKSKNAEFSPKEDTIDVETTKQEYLHKKTSQTRALEDQTEEEKKDCISFSMDSDQKSQTMKENREAVDKDFIDACYFLRDHMDKVSEPDDEMSQALTVMFQQWFHISAEEGACADTVEVYLNEVNSQTPTVLQFLVNMADDNGNTALHYSVSHCSFSIVKLLLDTGVCDVDLRNKSGYTAVMLASLTAVESPGDMKVVQQLMELGDVNASVGQVGQTALHLAVRHGRVPMVRLLLEQGADPDAQDHAGTTPLISACDRGHVSIVRILLEEANCDVSLKDKGGRSALSLATQASHTEIADLLKARTETKSTDKCKVS